MSEAASIRIPVQNADGVIIERIDSARARRLSVAPNATAIRARKGGKIVRIILESVGDDSAEDAMFGNPRSYSHNHETETNPEKVWTLKRIPTDTADLYDTVVNELAA